MKKYLKSNEIINWQESKILSNAKELAYGRSNQNEIAESCFKWVRDYIKHNFT